MEQELHVRDASTLEVRARIRENDHAGPTGGLASGFVQANLVILPGEYAFDFLKFCVRNPKPCPILEVTEAGDPEPVVTAPGADLRTDVPRYRVYENGELVEEPQDIQHRWQDDLVGFLLGCSFTFETALIGAGLPVAHVEQGRNVPMYVTDRSACRPACSPGRWSLACAHTGLSRCRWSSVSPDATPRCTVPPSTLESPKPWGSETCRTRSSVSLWSSKKTSCPCSGPAA